VWFPLVQYCVHFHFMNDFCLSSAQFSYVIVNVRNLKSYMQISNRCVPWESWTFSTAITKSLAEKQTEFHTYKPKNGRSYRVVLKNMHCSIPPADIKTEIEKLGHQVSNIWNITQYRTKLPLSVFIVELKPAPNNQDTPLHVSSNFTPFAECICTACK
jgi:hypothetical protein